MEADQIAFRTSSLAVLKSKRDIGNLDDPTYIAGARRVLLFMYEAWRKGKLCDVVLRLQGGEIKAHKIALATYSKMLAGRFQAQPPGELALLDLKNYDQDAAMTVLYFIYTTDIELTDYNVAQVLLCARELGIEMVEHMCEEYLNKYTVENALLYYSIAERYGFQELAVRIYTFICENFLSIAATPSFCYVPVEKLCMLLAEDNLRVESELDIFYAVLRWVDYDMEKRRAQVVQALQCVRFHLLPPEVIVTEVESVDWLMETGIYKFLYSLMRYDALHFSGSRLAEQYRISDLGERRITPKLNSPTRQPQRPGEGVRSSPRHAPSPGASLRRPGSVTPNKNNNNMDGPQTAAATKGRDTQTKSNTQNVHQHISGEQFQLLTIGGVDLEGLDAELPGKSVASWMSTTGQWSVFPMLPQYIHHHGVAVTDGKLYIIGGAVVDMRRPDQLGRATDAIYELDVERYSWRQLVAMREKRAYVSVAVQGGKIYAVGGEDEKKRKLDSIEYYDVEKGCWSYLARLPGGARLGCAVAIHQGCLYVVGGYNGQRDSPIMDAVLCFDLDREKWVTKHPLAIPRCHADLVSVRDKLLLIGGRTKYGHQSRVITSPHSSVDSLDSVEMYDVITDSWTLLATMSEARHDCSATAVGSMVFIVGGMRSPSPTCLTSVECLDIASHEWLQDVPPMPYPAAGTGCCALSL